MKETTAVTTPAAVWYKNKKKMKFRCSGRDSRGGAHRNHGGGQGGHDGARDHSGGGHDSYHGGSSSSRGGGHGGFHLSHRATRGDHGKGTHGVVRCFVPISRPSQLPYTQSQPVEDGPSALKNSPVREGVSFVDVIRNSSPDSSLPSSQQKEPLDKTSSLK